MLIFTWFIYIFLEAYTQYYLIEKRHWRPNYLQLFIIRGMASILVGGLVVGVGNLSDYAMAQYNIEIWMYKQAAAWFLFASSSFWITFDITLNYLRKRPIDYRGKTSGWLDRMPYRLWVVGKVLAFWVAVISSWYYVKHV